MIKDFDKGFKSFYSHTWLVSKWVRANYVIISESVSFLRFDQNLTLQSGCPVFNFVVKLSEC